MVMKHISTTPVPNSLFDVHLKKLKSAELKVLLVIIRQTLGWADKLGTTGRKDRDWIASRQLQEKTGASRRAISSATEILVKKNLIDVLDEAGTTLFEPAMRQGKLRLFYRPSSSFTTPVENEGIRSLYPLASDRTSAKFAQDLRKKRTALVQKMRITKETLQN